MTGVIARDPGPRPGLSRQVLKNEIVAERRFLNSSTSSAQEVVCVGILNRDVLVETWQRILEPRANQKARPKKYKLAVVDVAQHLTDGPLSRRVSVQALLLRRCLGGTEPSGPTGP